MKTRTLKELAQLLNEMRQAGVIREYALFGAAAQMRYTEPVKALRAAFALCASAQSWS